MNEPNVLGETPLHLCARWPKGMKLLIDAGADIDVGYDHGFPPPVFSAASWHAHESLRLLLEADCCMHIEYPPGTPKKDETLLKAAISNPDLEIIVSTLSRRRRSLETLAMTYLSQDLVKELGIRPDKVLDSKAGKAIEMLDLKKIPIPPSLRAIEPRGETVYHSCLMNPHQAELLWQSGFHDIDELDELGMSPLMRSRRFRGYSDFEEVLELPSWLLSKGANRYQLQRYAFRSGRSAGDRVLTPTPGYSKPMLSFKPRLSDSSSNIAALHYLGQSLGDTGIYLQGENSSLWRRTSLLNSPIQWSHNFLKNSYSPNIRSVELLRDILGDSLRDSCQCACSASGCLSFTQMSKRPSHWMSGFPRPFDALQVALVDTYCTAFILDVDNRPEMAWLRSEMFRFHTFQKLRLRHTCCTTEMDRIPITCVIAELGDEEDRQEIRLEQEEQVARLEALIDEFDREYQAKGIPVIDFFEGYWKQRMEEVTDEKTKIDIQKLKEIGVVVHAEDLKPKFGGRFVYCGTIGNPEDKKWREVI
jgi:hypothetical protein